MKCIFLLFCVFYFVCLCFFLLFCKLYECKHVQRFEQTTYLCRKKVKKKRTYFEKGIPDKYFMQFVLVGQPFRHVL